MRQRWPLACGARMVRGVDQRPRLGLNDAHGDLQIPVLVVFSPRRGREQTAIRFHSKAPAHAPGSPQPASPSSSTTRGGTPPSSSARLPRPRVQPVMRHPCAAVCADGPMRDTRVLRCAPRRRRTHSSALCLLAEPPRAYLLRPQPGVSADGVNSALLRAALAQRCGRAGLSRINSELRRRRARRCEAHRTARV